MDNKTFSFKIGNQCKNVKTSNNQKTFRCEFALQNLEKRVHEDSSVIIKKIKNRKNKKQ